MNLSSKFSCYLAGQPDHLTPEHQLRNYWSEAFGGQPLFLSKSCQLTGLGARADEIVPDAWLTKSFASMKDTAWVRGMVTGVWQPFWLRPEVQSVLINLQEDEPISYFSEHYKRTLAMAGILAPYDYEITQHQNLIAMLSRCSEQIQKQGYAPIAGLIHPFHVSALRRYYRNMIRTGKLPLGDNQSSRRYHAHNESVAQFFHFQLTATMSKIVGEPVKPSYVYFASYQGGAFLEKHTDRSQCEYSITFCLDYSPEPEGQTPWPLQLHTPKGITTVYQSIGDALVYRGCQLPHSRGVLPLGHSSTSIFFHYVPKDFSGTLD